MYEEENEPTSTASTKTESSSTATRSGDTARALIRRAKHASRRRRFRSEEKIRILLEGVRAEVSVAELCRREGIHPTVYYKWLKDFMEAGKKRLRGDQCAEIVTVSREHSVEIVQELLAAKIGPQS